MKFLTTALVLLCTQAVFGDVYMHNPRGSNNRLNEANVNRNNANRLFDSQNNGKGGYCVGPAMNFYSESTLAVEWTAQHACGKKDNSDCNIIIQYMCGAADAADATNRIRDGANTNRINNNAGGAADQDQGMHESYASYQTCTSTQRNQGLYIADRNLNGNTGQYTRQNNNGNRQGFECPEERDYYPYWRPSDWVDVAVMTSDTALCPFYQANSQNVKARGYCDIDSNEKPISADACAGEGGQWLEQPAHFANIPEADLPLEARAPDCVQAPFSRDNHLGNGDNGKANSYNWQMPTAQQAPCMGTPGGCACVLRLRYNISTSDYQAFGTYNPETQELEGFVDYRYDGDNTLVTQDPTVSSTNSSAYAGVAGSGDQLSLALNTNQYGRTFQDRTHVFEMKPKTVDGPILNIGVRGKRGNIVQTYPAVEYDFAPTNPSVNSGEFVHFQWTGCDTNPAGNAGEGTDQTDRSNIVQIESGMANYPMGTNDAVAAAASTTEPLFVDAVVGSKAAHFGLNQQSDCLSYDDLANNNNNNQNNIEQDEQNCMKGNPTEAQYVDLDVVQYSSPTTYHYMSTRNNNFTNRSQKASLTVTEGALPTWGVALAAVGAVVVVSGLAVAGLFAFARTHPHSAVANMFSRS